MSIGTPNGILDITGATLRVSKMEFRQSTGFDTVLNNVARNTMLLMDDTEQATSNSWALKLPNAWVAEFHGYWASGSSGAPILFNFYNDSTSGTNGYTLSMNDTAISINYDGGSALGSATLSSTLNNDAYRKVAIIFERSVLDVSVDGEHVFHFADSQLRDRVYDNNSGYVTFTHSSTDERKLKNLKFTNGDKWVREIDSSNIAYVGGNVGIGTTIPGTKLDVSGTIRGTHIIGDGSAISAIQSSNVSDFGSNVTRIGTLETDLSTVSGNLSDNSSRITTLESGDTSISGDKTFTGDIIFESNIHMNGGNVFVANTVNLTVSDPIIELGSNNSGTNDLGIIMIRHGATNSNVAVVYDEDVDILRMGYTLNGANDTVVDLDSNALAVSVQGSLGVGTTSPDSIFHTYSGAGADEVWVDEWKHSFDANWNFRLSQRHDVGVNVEYGFKQRYNTTEYSPITFRGTTMELGGNVGIGVTSPASKLHVDGTVRTEGTSLSSYIVTDGNGSIYRNYSSGSGAGVHFTSNALLPTNSAGTAVNGTVDLGWDDYRWARVNAKIGFFLDDYDDSSGSQWFGKRYNNADSILSGMELENTTLNGNYSQKLHLWTHHHGVSNGRRLTIAENGNVGIGTTGPTHQLHIGPKNNDHIYLASANNRYGWILDTDDQGNGVVPFRIIKRRDNVDTTTVTIDNAAGYVGIGTASPGHILHVEGTNPGSPIHKRAGTAATNTYNFVLNAPRPGTTTGGVVHFINGSTRTADGGVNCYTIRNDNGPLLLGHGSYNTSLWGQVGVNVAGGSYQFKVNGTSNFNAEMTWSFPSSVVSHAGWGANYDWYIRSGSTSGKVILQDSGGYIGMGTSLPSYKLHVSDGDNSVAFFGPNSTWSSYLAVGAASNKTATNNTSIAQCISTNGNLHLDAGHARDIYMNHYSGNYIHHNGLGVSSDDRLKSEEELITNATDTLLKLSPQKYLKKRTLREDEKREPVIETGLIAQDIWYDAPELRHIVLLGADADPTENKPEAPVDGDIQQDPDYSSWGPNAASVNYDGLISYLVKSNQELHGEIQALKARITTLENA